LVNTIEGNPPPLPRFTLPLGEIAAVIPPAPYTIAEPVKLKVDGVNVKFELPVAEPPAP
jgi:hypothetical protein